MKATIIDLEWNKGDSYLEQGIKNGKVPKNALYGSNGSFVSITSSELIIQVETEDGKNYRENIISVVKKIMGWKNLSEKRYKKLRSTLKGGKIDIEYNNGKIEIKHLKGLIKDL